MPMYEYQCQACGGRFERLSWGQTQAAPRCDCGAEQVERIWFSRVSVSSAQPEAPACAPGGCCGGGACARN
ncbi:MAG TPA: zinc ribbon domain-containing protein [Terriglobales bacterium]|nr:zinc ribbon domain-containing protein [Terriglobales bacterium]